MVMWWLVLIAVVLFCYSLMVVAKRSDERAEQMYREWKEAKHDRETRRDSMG